MAFTERGNPVRRALIRLRRAVFVLLFTVVAVLGLIPAGTASAATGCSGGKSMFLRAFIAQCQSGSYAVAGSCRNWLGYRVYVQGPRTSAPWTSIAYCPGDYWPHNDGWILHYS